MSRHGYVDDGDMDSLEFGRYRGAVLSAIRGKRGQAFLREMIAALDAMPEKRLIAHELVAEDGDVCAMGAVCKARGLDVSEVDASEPDEVASVVGLAEAMVREIAYANDDFGEWREPFDVDSELPARRWAHMRRWAEKRLIERAP